MSVCHLSLFLVAMSCLDVRADVTSCYFATIGKDKQPTFKTDCTTYGSFKFCFVNNYTSPAKSLDYGCGCLDPSQTKPDPKDCPCPNNFNAGLYRNETGNGMDAYCCEGNNCNTLEKWTEAHKEPPKPPTTRRPTQPTGRPTQPTGGPSKPTGHPPKTSARTGSTATTTKAYSGSEPTVALVLISTFTAFLV